MIRLDIITIAYENKEELVKTLKSINGIVNYIGLLIIKDGSTERLLQEDDELLKKFNNVLYLNTVDTGPYDAMNQALDYINNDFTWFLNSGDTLSNRENFLNSIEDLNTSYSMAIYNWTLDGNIIRKVITADIFLKRIQYTWGARHQSMLFNSKLIQDNNIRYDIDLKITADRKFMLDFARLTKFDSKYFFSKNIYLTNNDIDGLCQNKILEKEKENIIITNKYGNFFDKCKTFIIYITKIALLKVKKIAK